MFSLVAARDQVIDVRGVPSLLDGNFARYARTRARLGRCLALHMTTFHCVTV